jgi:hypothetical protein
LFHPGQGSLSGQGHVSNERGRASTLLPTSRHIRLQLGSGQLRTLALTESQRNMTKKTPAPNPLPTRDDGSSAPPQRLGSVSEACTYGRFSRSKCYDYIRSGRIDAYRRDKRTFIDFDSIDAMHAAVLTKIAPSAPALVEGDHV